MGRKKSPPETKKIRVSFSLDPDIYAAVKDLQSTSEWINNACRRQFDAGNKKKRKGKKG